MKNRIVSVFLVMLFLCRPAAGFEASVSNTVIPEGESFQLYLRQDGKGARPDISVLNEDFLITMERKSFKSSYVNGKTQTFNENVLTLIPKKTGKVVLPSIRAGNEKTAPITLTVVAGGQNPSDNPDGGDKSRTVQPNVFIRAETEVVNPYVGQQIPLTVRLYSYVRTPLVDGSVVPPKADGVTAEQWDEPKSRRETIYGRTYDVLEYRFLLFAQKSGKLELSPVQFRGAVSDPDGRPDEGEDWFAMKRNSFFSGLFNQKSVAVQSAPITLNVKPIPAGSGNSWLPSSEVVLSEDLTPPKQTIALGEAVTRTVTVMATGVRDTQIPDPVFADGAGYKQYPGKTDVKNLFDNKGIVGVKTRQIVFMPTVAGQIVLPSMEVPWFDVKTGKMKKAVLPSRKITVTGEASEETSFPAPAQSVRTEPAGNTQTVKKETALAEAFSRPQEDAAERKAALTFWEKYGLSSPWRLFLAGLLAGGAASLLLWTAVGFLMSGKKKASPVQAASVADDSNAVKRLREACQSGSAENAKRAFLDWARLHWPDNPPLTVTEAAGRTKSPALTAAADALNFSLYGSNGEKWNGEELWSAFKDIRSGEKKKTGEKIPVPPLYPQ